MPAATLGMWLFVASEAMFFVALLGSFVVLESAGDQHEVFAASSKLLSRWLAVGCAFLLALGSAAIFSKTHSLKWIAIAAGGLFLLLQFFQWHLLLPGNAPWRNNFFACYFLTSAVHGLHVVAGIVALAWFSIKPEPVKIYWHFVNAVGVLSLLVLYFVR